VINIPLSEQKKLVQKIALAMMVFEADLSPATRHEPSVRGETAKMCACLLVTVVNVWGVWAKNGSKIMKNTVHRVADSIVQGVIVYKSSRKRSKHSYYGYFAS
jgi:hypothetical protein